MAPTHRLVTLISALPVAEDLAKLLASAPRDEWRDLIADAFTSWVVPDDEAEQERRK